MNAIFSKEEVNTGRQREFDYLKGIFMLFIYLIHVFQATLSPEDSMIRWLYSFATMSGAAIFIFVMGIGTAYSRHAEPADFARSGVRMVIYQYLNNMAYVAALAVPYPFVLERLVGTETENLRFLIKMYMQYTNLFFITGIIYLVLALLKKFNLHTAWYGVIGAVASIAAPFIYGIPVNVPVVGYIVKLLIGEADFVSFTPLYFLSYALFGVAFGKMIRHVKDKAGFYRIFSIPAIAIVVVWWGLLFRNYGSDLSEMHAVLIDTYTHPNFWHVIASLAHILLFAAIFFFIEEIRKKDNKLCEPKNPVARQLLYYSQHISKYYALHVLVYFAAFGLNGYKNFQSYQCWLLALLSIVVTELMIRGFNYLSGKNLINIFMIKEEI